MPDYITNRASILLTNSSSTLVYWQFNTALDPAETFADFGVAWTYGAWNPDYPANHPNVQSPENWMNVNMTVWLQ
jgi:hypothetical protein